MTQIDDLIKADPTGVRAYIYKMMVMQGIVSKTDQNGHNTLFMTDVSSGQIITPMPTR